MLCQPLTLQLHDQKGSPVQLSKKTAMKSINFATVTFYKERFSKYDFFYQSSQNIITYSTRQKAK